MQKSGFPVLLAVLFVCPLFAWQPGRQPAIDPSSGAQTLLFAPWEKTTVAELCRGNSPAAFTLPPGDTLALVRTDAGRPGSRYFRLQQMHNGLLVYGCTAVAREENGALRSARGKLCPAIAGGRTPALSESDARARALDALPAERYAWQEPAFERDLKAATGNPAASFAPVGQLVFLPENLFAPARGSARLAWQFDLFAVAPEPARCLVFVDALEGTVLRVVPLLHTAHTPASGLARYAADTVYFNTDSFTGPTGDTLYRLHDLPRRIYLRDALQLPSNPNADIVHKGIFWGLPEHRTPVAALWGMEKWYDYLLQKHNWTGFANDTSALLAWVHFDHNFNNAFWNGNWVSFGDGDGVKFQPLVQLDIVAHECTHAVVQNTCGLLYQGEPGALNEGLCDIFAILAERYAFPQGWNWSVGEAAYLDHFNGLRRIDFPKTAKNPAAYGGQYWVDTEGCAPGFDNDQCGIHSNCTVLGKFFYILAHGETGDNELGTHYAVTGIGIDSAAHILFESLRLLLPTDGFAEMRAATLETARQLYPGTAVAAAVAQAWCAVGVGACDLAVPDSIVVLSPQTYATYQHGQPIPVQWAASPGVKDIAVYFSLNNGISWQFQQYVNASDGHLDLPAPPVFSKLCRLRLVDAANAFVAARTDTTFEITGCGLNAHFVPSTTQACFGQPFYAANDSPDSSATFQWRWNGADYPAPAAQLDIPALTVPGDNTIELLATDTAGCRDTFALIIRVLPKLTAEFTAEAHGSTLVARAHYPDADVYSWWLGGQAVGTNSPILTVPNVQADTVSLRLVVAEDACPGGVAEMAVAVVVETPMDCLGSKTGIRQITYTNDIIDIAEWNDKLYLAMPGCAAELDKNTHALKIFKPEDTNDVLSLPLTCVTVRQDGRVLFGTADCGIAVYDPVTGAWEKMNVLNTSWLPSDRILKMASGEDGAIWVLSGSGIHITKWVPNVDTIPYSPLSSTLLAIQPVGNELWFTSSGTIKLGKATAQGTIEQISNPAFPTNPTFTGITANHQKVWIVNQSFDTGASGLIEVDRANNNDAKFFNSTNSNLPANYHGSLKIAADKLGGVWMKSVSPELRYDGNGNFTTVDMPISNVNSSTRVVFVDSSNTYWRGTRTGLVKYKNAAITEVSLSTDFIYPLYNAPIDYIEASPVSNRVVISHNSRFFEISDYSTVEKWAGCTTNAKKFAIDSSDIIWHPYFNSIEVMTFEGICQINSSLPCLQVLPSMFDIKIWGKYVVFSASGKFLVFNPEAMTCQTIDLHPGNWYFANGNSETLWAKNDQDTLLELRPDLSAPSYHYTLPSPSNIRRSFAVNQENEIWFTRYNGPFGHDIIYHRNPDTDSIETIPTLQNTFHASISFLETDAMGNLWIGYNGIGLVKFSPGTNTYQLFTTCDGLPGNYPNGIAFTPDGRIWVATDNGVGIIIPSADTIFASFSLPYVCQSRPTTIPNATLGATAFRWELDGQTIATTKNLMYTFGQPGQHILTLVARNAQGCETAVSQVIEVHPEADLSKMPTTLVPCDNSAKLEAPAGLFRYEWRLPNGAASDGPSVAADKNGLYRLTVTDHCGGTAVEQITVLLSDCVWPGDVNTDGVVDYRDWVLMSPAFGFTGPARDAQDISFYGHPAQPWSGQLPNGANLKHADTDGNGVIDMHDFKAIEVNYGKSHGAHPGLGGPEPSPLHFVPMVLHTEKDPDKKQSTVTVGILVEDESGHLNTFSSFGGVFGWTLPAPLELAGEPKVDFMVDPGYGVEGTTVVSRFWPLSGRVALTRAPLDHLDRRNIQLLAAVDIIIIEDNVGIGDTLEVLFSFSGAQALTAGGAFLPIGTLEETFTVTDTKQPLDPRLADLGLLTFPNPSEGIFTAILTGADEGKTVFSVMDALGRPVWQETRNSARATIDLSGLPAGTYFLRAVSGHRQATRPLVKL